MEIDRRQVLLGTVCSAMALSFGTRGTGQGLVELPRGAKEWHPLTRSLLERAGRIGRGSDPPNRTLLERAVRQVADPSGNMNALVIKWMDTPKDAHDHLSGFGLDALLRMGSASLWRRNRAPISPNEETFDRALEVRMLADELLRVGEHDWTLIAPKLRAKSQAMSANLSDREVFRVRAVSAQIGWLETSMADVAAQTIANVELLLSTGECEGSVAIDHQLKVFDAHEYGLMATWETADALICVPKIQT